MSHRPGEPRTVFGPDGELGVAEERDPDVQREEVQGRVNVPHYALQALRQSRPCDFERKDLVAPETLEVEVIEPQRERQRGDPRQRKGDPAVA